MEIMLYIFIWETTPCEVECSYPTPVCCNVNHFVVAVLSIEQRQGFTHPFFTWTTGSTTTSNVHFDIILLLYYYYFITLSGLTASYTNQGVEAYFHDLVLYYSYFKYLKYFIYLRYCTYFIFVFFGWTSSTR